MIKQVVSFSQHQPLLVIFALLIFVGSGILAFLNLPIEAFPDVSDLQVTVVALFPGRAAEEVEQQVTLPIEVALSGCLGLVLGDIGTLSRGRDGIYQSMLR